MGGTKRAARYGRKTTIAIIVCGLTGLTSAIIGVILDFTSSHPLQNAPFLTNILSAACGALIGVPIALLVLQNVISRATEQAQWRSTMNLAIASIEEVMTLLDAQILNYPNGFDLYKDLAGAAEAIEPKVRVLLPAYARARDERNWSLVDPQESARRPASNELKAAIQELLADLKETKAAFGKYLPTATERELVRPYMEARWNFLQNYVRPRVLELEGRWHITEADVWIPRLFSHSLTRDSWEYCLTQISNELESFVHKGYFGNNGIFLWDAIDEIGKWRKDLLVIHRATPYVTDLKEMLDGLKRDER
ncbi:hypothetical protein V5P93_000360 [Actinokineospora auranticolor]|uniref:Uncharacterized protein n=1 Tax=Actinokineospora auranticolor TaxID=155976 RepID=A0A2S6GKN6_9PSEU|nr:hypothetical protein [Actinokineospora auranticolor]PPK65750.1 hypothetical protein CLV40_1129 [Actinokineospora auranticolor]